MRARPPARARDTTPEPRRLPRPARNPRKARSVLQKAADRGAGRRGEVAVLFREGAPGEGFVKALQGLQCEVRNRNKHDPAAAEWIFAHLALLLLNTADKVAGMKRNADREAAIAELLKALPDDAEGGES